MRKLISFSAVAFGILLIFVFMNASSPTLQGVAEYDSRCGTAYTAADQTAILNAITAAGKPAISIQNHAFNRLGYGANEMMASSPAISTGTKVIWDPSQRGTLFTSYSPDGLTITKQDGAKGVYSQTAAFANVLLSTGKWYFEERVDKMISGNRQRIGIGSQSGRVFNGPGTSDYSIGMDFNGTYSSYNPVDGYKNYPMPNPIAVKNGDILGVAMDFSTLKISFYVNDVLSGTLPIVGGRSYSPMTFASNNSNYQATVNFGAKYFRYAPPIGYKAVDLFQPVAAPIPTLASIAGKVLLDLRSGSLISAPVQAQIAAEFPLSAAADEVVMWTLIGLYEDRDKNPIGSTQYLAADRLVLNFRNTLAEELAAKSYMAAALHPSIGVGEMQTEFWFNHFNVFSRDTDGAAPAMENDIRTSICGTFSEMLLKIARSPAMLTYLNNNISVGKSGSTPFTNGINENYARELMELHTFGVGPTGGIYDQASVREVAKILTGWTHVRSAPYSVVPGSSYRLFQFNSAVHFPGTKTVFFSDGAAPLAHSFANGEAGGVALLKYLAAHAQTKKNICTKIGQRLMSTPPAALVNRCISAWTASGGSLPRLMMAYLSATEFWRDDIQNKIRNPYELALATHRLLGKSSLTRVQVLRDLDLIKRLGMRMKGLLPPTGYSEDSYDWLSSGYISSGLGMINSIAEIDRPSLSDSKTSGATLEAALVELANVDPSFAAARTASDVLPVTFETPLSGGASAMLLRATTSGQWDTDAHGIGVPARTYSTMITGSRWFFGK